MNIKGKDNLTPSSATRSSSRRTNATRSWPPPSTRSSGVPRWSPLTSQGFND